MLKKLTVALTAAALALAAACGSSDSGSDDALVIGASPSPHAEILTFVKDNLAADAGLDLEIQEFSDYVQPNIALNDGLLDANYFQHKPYLEDFEAEKGLDLAWVGDVHLEPLGVYSKKVTALDALKSGAVVAIPNDATNGARALALLADQGVITLKDGAGVAATERDITANPKGLKFKALEAAQLPRSLQDVDAAVINGNYAISGGLVPSEDALALESADGNPYANGLVVKTGDEKDAKITKLLELLQSPETRAFIEEKYEGSVLPAK
ncbi:MetQ/NlpA family ABC transporter substrate-binding protein [Actinocorallia sp. A-T 12471]|uniref:MetQ/NlpA family ABC transporter substrate-binding protein n=1 Tax=Actinocorallia sp. A-T 12471 TaxID=3089813 RepID=UPI0029CFD53A|nr:MetQ/NlpA family ABC transporter substrate-binding protein [Actinocorallia sp. A-T 12471]MDX6739858.1 MetQ/NlpA family ABC transporter substrate-binding protein [Actinocorallia sp. A-T 12471]